MASARRRSVTSSTIRLTASTAAPSSGSARLAWRLTTQHRGSPCAACDSHCSSTPVTAVPCATARRCAERTTAAASAGSASSRASPGSASAAPRRAARRAFKLTNRPSRSSSAKPTGTELYTARTPAEARAAACRLWTVGYPATGVDPLVEGLSGEAEFWLAGDELDANDGFRNAVDLAPTLVALEQAAAVTVQAAAVEGLSDEDHEHYAELAGALGRFRALLQNLADGRLDAHVRAIPQAAIDVVFGASSVEASCRPDDEAPQE